MRRRLFGADRKVTFLHPAWLLLAALIPLMLALHIRRRKTIILPSVQLWRHLPSGAAPRRRLQLPRSSLPLALQLLAVSLLTLALAEPSFEPEAGASHRIFVIDAQRGAGAQGHKALAVALEQIASEFVIEPPAAHRRISVIVASAEPHFLAVRLSSSRGLERLLATTSPEEAAPDWPRVGRLIGAVRNQTESTQLFAFTDSALPASIAPFVAGMKVKAVASGVEQAQSERLAGFAAAPMGSKAAGRWRITGALAAGPAGRPVEILFRPSGAVTFLPWAFPETVTSGVFTIDVELPGPGILQARPMGGLAGMQSSFLVLREPGRQIRVAIMGAESSSLSRALQAVGDVELTRVSSMPADMTQFDLAVVDNVVIPRHPGVSTLWLGAARLQAEPSPQRRDDIQPTAWDRANALSSDVAWELLKVRTAAIFKPMPGAKTLLSAGDTPLVQERKGEFGREVRVSFSLEQSNWADLAGFPIFISNLMRALNIDVAPASACIAGTPCPVEQGYIRPDTKLYGPDGDEILFAAPRLLATSGIDLSNGDNAFVPLRSGLYRIVVGGEAKYLAVNPPDVAALSESFPDKKGAIDVRPYNQSVWVWLVVLALLILFVEAWVAGRGSERFLTLVALRADNPLATRRRMILGLRGGTGVLLFVSILQLPAPMTAPAESVVAIVDSASFVKHAPGGEGVVIAGSDPRIAVDLDREVAAAVPEIKTGFSGVDLQQAIDVATAMIPPDRKGRVVLAEDIETRGNVAAAIRALLQRQVKLDVRPSALAPPGNIAVESISVPSPVRAGDKFPLTSIIRSNGESTAIVRIARDNVTIVERDITLQDGFNRVETIVAESLAGRARYEVSVTSGGDIVPADNHNGIVVNVEPAPRIAIVAPESERGSANALIATLKVHGIAASMIAAKNAPWSLREWLAHDVLILLNLPAIDLDTRQQEMIETAVMQHGRGLMILGGENAFGPGGYFGTPLERLSPLSARIPTEAPQAAMVFVLDRSGSMTQSVGEGTRLDIAKSATRAAIELLHDESDVAIVTFDSEAHVILPLQKKNMAAVTQALAPLTPGGGTSIYPGLAEAEQQLFSNDSKLKHVVVMTDGLTQPGDFAGVVGRLRAMGATVSGLAIGSNADPAAVQEIARLGGGSFHATNDFQALPGILAREAMLLSGEPVRDKLTQPVWVDTKAAFLENMPPVPWRLGGYVLTTAKPRATLHLSAPEDSGPPNPLLASWRYGNGRVLALATHGSGGWAREWQADESYPLFWSQVVRAFLPEATKPGLDLRLTRNRDEVRVSLQMLEPDGRPRSAKPLVATLVGPTKESVQPVETNLVLKPNGAGIQTAAFMVERPGDYTVRVTDEDAGAEAVLHVAYPAAILQSSAIPETLRSMSAATGGTILAAGAPLPLGADGWQIVMARNWRFWLLLAFAAFMLDLLLRYAPGLFARRSR